MPSGQRALAGPQRRQFALITVGAIVIFALLRLLPTGTNLSHMDFRVDAKNSIEFCDPLNPQFIPVVAVRSPVTMTLVTGASPRQGETVSATVALRTASGKPLAPEDLLVMHTQKLHLLLVDPTLADYQHLHPTPTTRKGEWAFAFTPRAAGTYRVFADFTPAATSRGLYASVDLEVSGRADANSPVAPVPTRPALSPIERDGYRFTLTPGVAVLRAGQPIDLKFALSRGDGAAVPLAPIMGAFAHLVAFDEARSGFAHLHPLETDLAQPPDSRSPVLNFKITIPRPGRYVIWAQVNLGGQERFVPFGFEVGG